MLTIKSILQRAKTILVEGGWTKGKNSREDGSHCAQGAIAKACADLGLACDLGDNPAFNAIKHVQDHLPNIHLGLVTYNDLPDTTAEDIFAVFDSAIAACPAEETQT
jgi:hypothetical protein